MGLVCCIVYPQIGGLPCTAPGIYSEEEGNWLYGCRMSTALVPYDECEEGVVCADQIYDPELDAQAPIDSKQKLLTETITKG